MRALRITALGLSLITAACWLERPNLRSTGGGYGEGPAARPADSEPGAAEAGENPAATPPPAPINR